jgi:hypothetical protein
LQSRGSGSIVVTEANVVIAERHLRRVTMFDSVRSRWCGSFMIRATSEHSTNERLDTASSAAGHNQHRHTSQRTERPQWT